MPMLNSGDAVERRAKRLLDSYDSFEHGVLVSSTDTRNAPKFIGELRSLQSFFAAFGKAAREVMGLDGFAALEPKLKDDIIAIAEECEEGVAELDDSTHPEKLWSRLDEQTKFDLTARAFVDNGVVARARSRGKGEVRAAKAQPPKK